MSRHCANCKCNPLLTAGYIPGDNVRRISLPPSTPRIFRTAPWGLLEGFEVFLENGIPNMDASYPFTLEVEIRDPNGANLSNAMRVFQLSRDVITRG